MTPKKILAKDIDVSDVALNLAETVKNSLIVPAHSKNDIARNLTKLRTAAGLTQGDVANMFSISQGAVGNWESTSQDKCPPPYAVMLLSSLYGSPVEALVVEGDNTVECLLSQFKATWLNKVKASTPYEIRDIFKCPQQLGDVEERVSQLESGEQSTAQDLLALKQDISSLKSDWQQWKHEQARLVQKAMDVIQGAAANGAIGAAQGTQPMGAADAKSLSFSRALGMQGYNFDQAANYRVAVINDASSTLHFTKSKHTGLVATYDPRVTDLAELNGFYGVFEDEFGQMVIREISLGTNGRYIAVLNSDSEQRQLQDIESTNLAIKGKLIMIAKLVLPA